MSCDVPELFAKRHSFYDINDSLPIKEDEITDIIKEALRLYPSAFNAQEARLVVLYSKEHRNFWNEVKDVLLQNSPDDNAEAIKKRISSFANGYGTVLFFMDNEVIRKNEKQWPLYATNMKIWAHHSNAMLQFMLWSAFADKSIGANLQHYNPLIDNMVYQSFNIPKHWELVAQMPFGGIVESPLPHSVENIENKLIVFGK